MSPPTPAVMASSSSSDWLHRLVGPTEILCEGLVKISNQRKARPVAGFESAPRSLVSVSAQVASMRACGFATLLAGVRIFDELK